MADRSPEPADEREWTLLQEWSTVQAWSSDRTFIGPDLAATTHPHARAPFDPRPTQVVVVPKSRLDAAMAAADERERALEAERDEAIEKADRWVRTANASNADAESYEAQVRALTEALREARLLIGRVPNEQVVWAIDKGLRAALPVPVEGEPEEEKR